MIVLGQKEKFTRKFYIDCTVLRQMGSFGHIRLFIVHLSAVELRAYLHFF